MSCSRLEQILSFAVRQDVSDVHLNVGRPPLFRKDGRLLSNKSLPALPGGFFDRVVEEMLSEAQRGTLGERGDVDLAHSVEGSGRFRGNIFRQMGALSMVWRHIPEEIKPIADLGMPDVIADIALEPRGLVLVTGATGSGKSTTLAAMIHHVNTHKRVHIITIEDPIEFVHSDAKSLVSQRQIGEDATSFASALRAALRQDPDLILVGEMRDRETVETALHAAETGHMVMSTLHTVDAKESVARIVNMFPSSEQGPLRFVLAGALRAVISQRLVRRRKGDGRVPAVEVMLNTARVHDLIVAPDLASEIPMAIAEGNSAYRSQTFDQSLLQLYRDRIISLDEALSNATRPADFKLKVSGISGLS